MNNGTRWESKGKQKHTLQALQGRTQWKALLKQSEGKTRSYLCSSVLSEERNRKW